MARQKRLRPYLVVYFNKVVRKKKGHLRDDAGTVIPKEKIFFHNKHYIMFRDGWELVAKDDYSEIRYPHTTLIFSEGKVQNVVVSY